MAAINRILRSKQPTQNEESQPPPDNQYEWIQQYNSETWMDNSMAVWPNDPQLKKQINLPLSLSMRPFDDVELREASFSPEQILAYRCFACKSFINKLCHLREYDCSICGTCNTLKQPIDVNSAELTNMAYEVEATQEYSLQLCRNQIFAMTPPTLALVVDVSKGNRNNLYHFVYAIKEFIKQLTAKDFYQILLVTFDKHVHYYDLVGDETKKIIMVDEPHHVRDIEILGRVQDKLLDILDSLEQQAEDSVFTEGSAMFEALEFACKACAPYCGRILVCAKLNGKHSAMQYEAPPNVRPDSLDAHRALQRRFLKQIQEGRMGMSFFLFTAEHIVIVDSIQDLLSFYPLCRFTNGCLHLYKPGDELQFYYDISLLLLSRDYYDSEMKVRFSPGIKLIAVFGSYLPVKNSNDHIKMLTCSSTSSYLYEYSVEAKVNKPYLVTQFSMLFTSQQGKRRFRIINYVLQLSESIPRLLAGIDYGGVNHFYLKAAAQTMDTNMDQKTIRMILQDRFSRHTGFCRLHLNDKKLSEQTGEYARVTYCLLRSKHLNLPYSQTQEWDRIADLRAAFLRLPYSQMVVRVFPMMYAIDTPFAEQNSEQQDIEQNVPVLDLTTQTLKQHCFVLLDKADEILLYINVAIPKTRTLLGDRLCDEVRKNQLNEERLNEHAADNPYVHRMLQLVGRLRSEKMSGWQPLRLAATLDEYMMFSQAGNFSFQNFINFVVK